MSHPHRLTTLLLALMLYVASAQGASAACVGVGQYDLLAPLGTLSGCVDLTTYLKGIFETAIGIAGILAVIMIVICGIQLMASGSVSGKSAAKDCITNAIFGLLLAIGSWLLLNTINPLLLKSTATLPDIAQVVAGPVGPKTDPIPKESGWYFRYQDAAGNIKNSPRYYDSGPCLLMQQKEEGNGSVIQNGPNGTPGCFEVREAPQPAGEIATRQAICGNDSCTSNSNSNVYINRNSCNPHDLNGVVYHCTNVDGLPGSAISTIQGLTGSCNCKIIITGGTENGHTTHGPGLPIFDLSKVVSLVTYIKANGTGPNDSFCKKDTGGGNTCYKKWLYNGYWFTDEGDHFHVCQDGTPAPTPEKTNVFRKACTKI